MKTFNFVSLAALLIFPACRPEFNPLNLFTYKVQTVEDLPLVCAPVPEEESLSGITDLWRFEVWDTLVVYHQSKMGNSMYHVSGLKSGEDYGHFCRRGRGAGEVLVTNPSFQIVDGKLVLFDLMKGIYYELDLNRSLETGNTEYARQVQFKDYSGRTYQHPRLVSDDRALMFDSATVVEGNRLSHTPCFSLFDLGTGERIRDYQCFQNVPLERSKGSEMLAQELITMNVCTDSIGHRLCFAMNMFPHIGFIDIETGETKGLWIKGKHKFSLKDANYFHFLGCESDGERIYSLYQGVFSGVEEQASSSELYIFNWAGDMIGRLLLDRRYYWLSLYEGKLYLQYFVNQGDVPEARFCSLKIEDLNNILQN